MLHLLDETLEAFLRAEVPLSERQVDVVFEAPDGDWAAGVTRPTVDLYLWDVRPNLAEREYGEEVVELPDGTHGRRPPLPRVDCRFLVTAWTSEVRDEHSLLGGLMRTFLLNTLIPREHLVGTLANLDPLPRIQLRGGDASANSDFWSAVGGQLKPGLDVVLTIPVDASIVVPFAPAVADEGVQVGVSPTARPR